MLLLIHINNNTIIININNKLLMVCLDSSITYIYWYVKQNKCNRVKAKSNQFDLMSHLKAS